MSAFLTAFPGVVRTVVTDVGLVLGRITIMQFLNDLFQLQFTPVFIARCQPNRQSSQLRVGGSEREAVLGKKHSPTLQ